MKIPSKSSQVHLFVVEASAPGVIFDAVIALVALCDILKDSFHFWLDVCLRNVDVAVVHEFGQFDDVLIELEPV